MQTKKVRILSILLAAILSAGALVSCSGGKENPNTPGTSAPTSGAADTTAPSGGEDTTPGTTARSEAKDNLPADLKFDGETINVIYRNEEWYANWDMIGTDNSGDIIWDAIWQRNINVEERFGITLNIQPTTATGLNNVANELKQLVFAGSDEYDIICSTANTTVQQSLYPYLYELSEMENLDITQPWWRTAGIGELSFDGKHYRYLMGDNTLNDYLKCGVVFYNKDIYEASSGGSADAMYQTVLDGEWTYDKLAELTEAAYSDANGSGAEDAGDTFGLMLPKGYAEATLHMVYGCDIETYKRGDDGLPDLSVFNNEHTIAIIDKLNQICHQTKGVYLSDKSIDQSPSYFAENNSLFWTGRLSNAVSAVMREMESDYGVLPMPKFDKEQKDYITLIHTSATVTCVPKSVSASRASMIGAVLEGWASEAYRTVITPFIESALKLKYSRDALSGQVIDIVFENPEISFVAMYGANMNNVIDTAVLNLISAGKNNFSSVMAKLLTPSQKTLSNYIDKNVTADN